MSDFDVLGVPFVRRDRRNMTGLVIALGLAGCFVLGVILCFGILVNTVVYQAGVANENLNQGAKSLTEMQLTAKGFVLYSEKIITKLQSLFDSMVKDLDQLVKDLDQLVKDLDQLVKEE